MGSGVPSNRTNKIVTYSVNNTTAVTKKLGTLNTAYSAASPITVYRSGSFLYVLGFSPAQEYFTVYSLTAAGVPEFRMRRPFKHCLSSLPSAISTSTQIAPSLTPCSVGKKS
jgi:hypothetical protein